MNDDLAELKNRILEGLDHVDPEEGQSLIGLSCTIRDASLDQIEAAVRELLLEGKIAYWGADNLEEDGDLAAFVPAEPAWVDDVLKEIDDLPEVP